MAKVIDITTRLPKVVTPSIHTVITNCKMGWFRDDRGNWSATGIYQENGRYWRYQYYWGEYTIYEVAPEDVKWSWSEEDDQIEQAFEDWRNRKAYIDNNGNYRVRTEPGKGGKIARWNKVVKRRFKSVSDFHKAACQ